jgi:hypothetical protein
MFNANIRKKWINGRLDYKPKNRILTKSSQQFDNHLDSQVSFV